MLVQYCRDRYLWYISFIVWVSNSRISTQQDESIDSTFLDIYITAAFQRGYALKFKGTEDINQALKIKRFSHGHDEMTIADYEFIQQDSSTIYILYIDHDKIKKCLVVMRV